MAFVEDASAIQVRRRPQSEAAMTQSSSSRSGRLQRGPVELHYMTVERWVVVAAVATTASFGFGRRLQGRWGPNRGAGARGRGGVARVFAEGEGRRLK